jgi:ABC-type dipeptide/oligopeptide/nickel transport system permease component
MYRYFLVRLIQSVLLLFGVLLLVFAMVRVTGDPARLMMPREASPEQVEAFREAMGFNRPIIVQFMDFMSGAVMGDFGKSLHFKIPALSLVLERLPATVELAGVALLMAVVIAIPLGLIGGFNPGSFIDSLGRGLALFGQSIPNFWLALIMILLFAVKLGWFPSFGRDDWKSVIMPAFVLGLPTMGQLVRLTRSAVLEVRGEDFIRTAHSKGLEPRVIYTKHVLRNVAIPLVSVIGWRDFYLVQAIAFFTSLVVLAINLLTDVAYAIIDPRIRYGN